MKLKFILVLFFVMTIKTLFAQYHTLSLPEESPYVEHSQQLGVTTIEVQYHSPSIKGRKVWGGIVPMNGNPIPWRAGANENTKISFSTDVYIDGNLLAKGSYGLQTIPGEQEWIVIFTNNDNLWGSYYYDSKTDDALRITVKPEDHEFRECLAYEFVNRTDSTVQLALQWDKLSVQIPIRVDLNKTVLESFRHELRGHLNMSWAAWNEAARWCLGRNINYEEAFLWADRSINGGYGGFRADKNFENLSTKAELLKRLGKEAEAEAIKQEALSLASLEELYGYTYELLDSKANAKALQVAEMNVRQNGTSWISHLGYARALSVNNQVGKAKKELQTAAKLAPENRKKRLEDLLKQLEEGKSIL